MPAVLGVEGFRLQFHKSTMRRPSHISHRSRPLSWYRLDGPPVSLVSLAGACAAAQHMQASPKSPPNRSAHDWPVIIVGLGNTA
jgi:hypothetical protein